MPQYTGFGSTHTGHPEHTHTHTHTHIYQGLYILCLCPGLLPLHHTSDAHTITQTHTHFDTITFARTIHTVTIVCAHTDQITHSTYIYVYVSCLCPVLLHSTTVLRRHTCTHTHFTHTWHTHTHTHTHTLRVCVCVMCACVCVVVVCVCVCVSVVVDVVCVYVRIYIMEWWSVEGQDACSGVSKNGDHSRPTAAIRFYLLSRRQFSAHTKSSRARIDKRTACVRYRCNKISPLDHKLADNCVSLARTNTLSSTITKPLSFKPYKHI